MKNLKHLLFGLMLLITGTSFSQATSEGDMFFDFGIGVGRAHSLSYYGYNYNYGNRGYNDGYSGNLRIPTISLSLQKAFWDDITIGGIAAFNIYGYDWNRNDVNYSESWEVAEVSTLVGARGEYHFNRLIGWDDSFDLYAGVIAGVRVWGYKGTHKGNNNGNTWNNEFTDNGVDPMGGVMAGFRYYFGQNIAVYGEVGYAITNLRAGLCWKL